MRVTVFFLRWVVFALATCVYMTGLDKLVAGELSPYPIACALGGFAGSMGILLNEARKVLKS